MNPGIEWATFLVVRRTAIDQKLAQWRGATLPGAGSPETEALRRFRSFAASSLRRGDAGAPSLDGLRVDAGAVTRLVEDWCHAAGELAGDRQHDLRLRLDPLIARFRSALIGTELAHEARRAPRTRRRAVSGAIDRIADAFLAVEIENFAIADANPAAGALLRTPRETLIGGVLTKFLSAEARETWTAALEPLLESAAPRRFLATLVDARGDAVTVEIHATRVETRERVLALLIARPI